MLTEREIKKVKEIFPEIDGMTKRQLEIQIYEKKNYWNPLTMGRGAELYLAYCQYCYVKKYA